MYRSQRQHARIECSRAARRRAASCAALEPLETRRLLATFTVNGTAGPDLITLSAFIGFITANVNGTPTTQPTNNVTDIVINGLGGNDIIRIENNAGKPTTVNGGDGDEFIDFSYATRDLDFITGSTTVRGGTGNDGVFVYDDNNVPQEDFFITDARFDREGWGGFFYASDIESLALRTGTALDRVYVASTFPNQPVALNSAGGNDVVAVGDGANGTQRIRSQLTISNDAALSSVWLVDAVDTSARHVTVDVVNRFTQVSGIAPAPIRMEDVSGLLITTGYANDRIDILRSSTQSVRLENRDGIDGVTVGNSTNGVRSVISDVWVAGHPELDGLYTLNVNNAPDTLGRSVAINYTNSQATGEQVSVEGLAPGSIKFNPGAIAANSAITVTNGGGNDNVVVNSAVHDRFLSLRGGGGDDAFTVNQTAFSSFTWIDGGDGTDAINVKETRTNSGPITLIPSTGDDLVTVNDNVGSAHVVFGGTQTLGSLVINAGPDSHASIPAGTNRVLTVKSLSIGGPGAVLNLADNDLIVDYTGASPIASIQAWLTSGYNGGGWTGQGGINTSAATASRGLGFAEASEIFAAFPATFSGQAVDNTAVLVKYTFYGDANLDGTVNTIDLNKLAANFGASPRRWAHGNFDYDADVDTADFNRLASNFGSSGLAPDDDWDDLFG